MKKLSLLVAFLVCAAKTYAGNDDTAVVVVPIYLVFFIALAFFIVQSKRKQKEKVNKILSNIHATDKITSNQQSSRNPRTSEPAQETRPSNQYSAETVKAQSNAPASVETVKAQSNAPASVETVKANSSIGNQEPVSQGGYLPVGTLLQDGRYKVVRYLASGGFGNTYLIEHTRLGTYWAMKEFFMKGINARTGTTVSVSLSDNNDVYLQMKDKFLKEAKRISSLKNGHIIELIDFFEENGTAYYVMKYIEGKSLSATMKENNAPLTESQVRNYLPQVLDALRCMHEHQLYHLDLKPGNIMQEADGHICLIDFGASKQLSAAGNGTLATTTGLSYTPGFAPSEQISGNMKRIGPWTDFYALGATLYNLLTNSTPPEENDIMYDGEKAFDFGSMSSEMQSLILHLMNPRYDKRPQSVDEIVL